MSRQGVLDAIATHLNAVTTPTFQHVIRAEPLSVPASPAVGFWYAGDSTLFESLGDVSIEERFIIRALWRIEEASQVRESVELEVWNANRAIQTALRGDSQLGGNCTDLKLAEATVGYVQIGGAVFRALTIPVAVWVYESEAIAP